MINIETYNPEAYTSQQVYERVMLEALPLSVLNPEFSARRDALYNEVGVVRVCLEPSRVDFRGHKGLTSNQTVQECGSYKVRGSANAVLHAREIDPNLTDIHICSAGNAAYGALQACSQYGIKLTSQCVKTASPAKIGTLRLEGATVHNVHDEFEGGRQAALLLGEQQHHATIEAYDQIETIAGQATIGWETLADLLERGNKGEIDLHNDSIKLFAAVGGGGHISGIACVLKWARGQGLIGPSNVQLIGVQMEGCDAMKRSIDYERWGVTPPQDLFAEGPSFDPKCDGTAVRQPGRLTRAIIADPELVTDIITVSEGELGQAMKELTAIHNVMVEPAGALSQAGAKKYANAHPFDRRRPAETLITFTTGANVSPDLYRHFMTRAKEWRNEQVISESVRLEAYREYLRSLGGSCTTLATMQDPERTATRVRSGTRVVSSPARS